jgi:hypothetical protein
MPKFMNGGILRKLTPLAEWQSKISLFIFTIESTNIVRKFLKVFLDSKLDDNSVGYIMLIVMKRSK